MAYPSALTVRHIPVDAMTMQQLETEAAELRPPLQAAYKTALQQYMLHEVDDEQEAAHHTDAVVLSIQKAHGFLPGRDGVSLSLSLQGDGGSPPALNSFSDTDTSAACLAPLRAALTATGPRLWSLQREIHARASGPSSLTTGPAPTAARPAVGSLVLLPPAATAAWVRAVGESAKMQFCMHAGSAGYQAQTAVRAAMLYEGPTSDGAEGHKFDLRTLLTRLHRLATIGVLAHVVAVNPNGSLRLRVHPSALGPPAQPEPPAWGGGAVYRASMMREDITTAVPAMAHVMTDLFGDEEDEFEPDGEVWEDDSGLLAPPGAAAPQQHDDDDGQGAATGAGSTTASVNLPPDQARQWQNMLQQLEGPLGSLQATKELYTIVDIAKECRLTLALPAWEPAIAPVGWSLDGLTEERLEGVPVWVSEMKAERELQVMQLLNRTGDFEPLSMRGMLSLDA